MVLHYNCNYTIAYVNYSFYICTAYHMTAGARLTAVRVPLFRAVAAGGA